MQINLYNALKKNQYLIIFLPLFWFHVFIDLKERKREKVRKCKSKRTSSKYIILGK